MKALKARKSYNRMIAEREQKTEQERIEKMTPEEREQYEQEKRERDKRVSKSLMNLSAIYGALSTKPYK